MIDKIKFRSSNYHRVIGDVHGGVNSPLDAAEVKAGASNVFLAPNKTHQIKLTVNNKKQSVVMQALFHMPGNSNRMAVDSILPHAEIPRYAGQMIIGKRHLRL